LALSKQEEAIFNRLSTKIRRDAAPLQRLDDYYNGMQRLEQLGLAIPPELRRFIVIVNWCRIAADSLEERIDFEGYRYPGKDKRDPELWRIWQANGLDEESQKAHLDAIIFGRSYIVVGAGDRPDTPLVTVESPQEMAVDYNPRTHKVSAALKLYKDDTEGAIIERATLYLPNVTIWLKRGRSLNATGWIEDTDVTDTGRNEHGLNAVPVVPLVNRARLKNPHGVSELADVVDLVDAAGRALTLAQLATETLSVPQRAILGASANDFVDENGNDLPTWEAYFGAIWALENPNAKIEQFDAADLANFDKIVSLYAKLVSSVTGLPMRYFGENTANPPSEGSIIADETRLIKHAERRHRAWGGAWEQVARLVVRIKTGDWDEKLDSLESIWRNPATPTQAQTADAAVKLVQAGILPVEAAWEELGYSQTRIDALRKMRKAEMDDADALARAAARYMVPPDAPVEDEKAPAAPAAETP